MNDRLFGAFAAALIVISAAGVIALPGLAAQHLQPPAQFPAGR